MNTDKLVELFREEVEKLEKEAYERGKRDVMNKSKIELRNLGLNTQIRTVTTPTSEIHYKTVKRVAFRGERILITKLSWNDPDEYAKDSVGIVESRCLYSSHKSGVFVDGWKTRIHDHEYEVIVEEWVQPLSDKIISDTNAEY